MPDNRVWKRAACAFTLPHPAHISVVGYVCIGVEHEHEWFPKFILEDGKVMRCRVCEKLRFFQEVSE